MGTSNHPLIVGFCSACKPADRRPPWQWCEEHVQVDETSPLPGRWRADASPWVKPVMEDFANNAVRDIAVQCAAQSAKTQTVMNCACWAIAEDPGPAMWVTATKDELPCYTWNALLPHWIEWRSIVEEFLAAVDAMRVGGDIDPMFTFVTETLGEPWDLDRWMVFSDDAEWFLSQDPRTGKTIRRVAVASTGGFARPETWNRAGCEPRYGSGYARSR